GLAILWGMLWVWQISSPAQPAAGPGDGPDGARIQPVKEARPVQELVGGGRAPSGRRPVMPGVMGKVGAGQGVAVGALGPTAKPGGGLLQVWFPPTRGRFSRWLVSGFPLGR